MNEQMKEKYAQFKMIEEQIKEISKQMDLIEKQQNELSHTIDALDEFPNITPDQEILLPLAAGIWVKGRVSDTQRMIVSIGSDVSVEKTLDQTKTIVEEQKDQLQSFEKQLTERLMQLSQAADKVNEELMQLQQEE